MIMIWKAVKVQLGFNVIRRGVLTSQCNIDSLMLSLLKMASGRSIFVFLLVNCVERERLSVLRSELLGDVWWEWWWGEGTGAPGWVTSSALHSASSHRCSAVTLVCLTPVSQHSTLSLVTQGFLSWLSFTGSLGGVQDERMSLGAKQAFGCICVVGLGPRPIGSELGSPRPTTDILLALFVIWTKGKCRK